MSQNNSSPGIVGYVGQYDVAIGSATSPFVIQGVTPGSTGTVLASNGVSANPSFQTLASIGAVTSVTGTTNEITASPTTGAVVLSTPSTFVAPGSIASTSSFENTG